MLLRPRNAGGPSAGFAEVIVPPTTDKSDLVSAIDNLTTSRGTVIGAATLKAIDALAAVNPDIQPTSTGAGGPPTATSVQVLDYRVVDAKLSANPKRLIMVSDTPVNALHIYAVDTASDVAVPLPSIPVAVSARSVFSARKVS